MKNIRFEEWEAGQMADPEFRAIAEEMEPAHQLARLRILKGMTQKELAKRTGMQQSTISRFENSSDFTFSTLVRVARALDAKVMIVPRHKTTPEGKRASSRNR